MKFIEDRSGHLINLAHAKSIICRWDKKTGRHGITCNMVDGDTIAAEITFDPSDLADNYQLQLIPAQSGFTELSYYTEEGSEDFIDRQPIIAWQLDVQLGFHRAVALQKPGDNARSIAILYPDGRVVDPGNQDWRSEGHWAEDQKKQRAIRAEEKKRENKETAQPHS
jgi:hypothetical protein